MHQHTEVTDVYLNELLKVNNKTDKAEQYWFPTPEQPGYPITYPPIQKTNLPRIIGTTSIRKTQST